MKFLQSLRICTVRIQSFSNNIRAFNNELIKQQKHYQSINEPIKVTVINKDGEKVNLEMIKNVSTPLDCLSSILNTNETRQPYLASVNGQTKSMVMPLQEDCEVIYQNFINAQEKHLLHKSAAFVINSVLKTYFRNLQVNMCGFDGNNDHFESFIKVIKNDGQEHGNNLYIDNYEFRSQIIHGFRKGHILKPLSVSPEKAMEILKNEPLKLKQIPELAANNVDGNIDLYSCGDFVDICSSPLIFKSNQFGHFQVKPWQRVVSEEYGDLFGIYGKVWYTPRKPMEYDVQEWIQMPIENIKRIISFS